MRKSGIIIIALIATAAFCACGTTTETSGFDVKDGVVLPDKDIAADGPVAETVLPGCEGKECGSDGAGGSCGTCDPGAECTDDGKCSCTPQCEGKECGADGCGDTCGDCGDGFECDAVSGACMTDPCADKQCGVWEGKFCGTCPCGDCDETADFCEPTTGQCVVTEVNECEEIWKCMAACPVEQEACPDNCVNDAPLESQILFNDLYQCYDDTGYWLCWDLCPEEAETVSDCPPEGVDCFEQKGLLCEDDYYGCFPPGDLPCDEMWLCTQGCEADEPDCPSECVNKGTIEAQKMWQEFVGCLDGNGYFACFDLPENEQEACIDPLWTECAPQLEVCLLSSPGELTCLEMYLCLQGCPESSDLCGEECLLEGTAEAYGLWDTFIDCLDYSGYFACTDNECRAEAWANCSVEFQACAHGDDSCADVLDCMGLCPPGDDMCALECLLNGTTEAQDGYDAILACIEEECGASPSADCQNEALNDKCKETFDTCAGG